MRRPRKPRPNRHRHFRSFWALLYREASYTIILGRFGHRDGFPSRASWWRVSKREVINTVARVICAYPERRYYP